VYTLISYSFPSISVTFIVFDVKPKSCKLLISRCPLNVVSSSIAILEPIGKKSFNAKYNLALSKCVNSLFVDIPDSVSNL